jgi:peptidoglycan hydrolase-like protein with peptidoglycan-binding domain
MTTFELQQFLQGHGYYCGPCDGIETGQVRAAVRAYQRDNGLPVTGVLDLQQATETT